MSRNRGLRLSLHRKEAFVGYIFVLPLIIGFIMFFLFPFIQSIRFSLSSLQVSRTGVETSFVGLQNFRQALFVHPHFVRRLTETVVDMVLDVPLVVMFSFFAATLLNQPFKGRLAARLVFFLPVIVASGVVLQIQQADYMMEAMTAADETKTMMIGAGLQGFLLHLRLPEAFLQYLLHAVDRIPDVINASGIQTLVFLAGLQSIPSPLYEVAQMEGATGWESFWKITFPLMSPLVVTNLIYSVIDSFASVDNQLVGLIQDTAFSGMGFGISSAMAWVYFAVIAVTLAMTAGAIRRHVFYME